MYKKIMLIANIMLVIALLILNSCITGSKEIIDILQNSNSSSINISISSISSSVSIYPDGALDLKLKMDNSAQLKLKMDNDLKLKLKLKMDNDLKLKMESDLKLKSLNLKKIQSLYLKNINLSDGLYLLIIDNKGRKYRAKVDDNTDYQFYIPIRNSYVIYYEYVSNNNSIYQILNYSDGLNVMCIDDNTNNVIDLQDVRFSSDSNTILTKRTPKMYIDFDKDGKYDDEDDDDDNDGLVDIEDLDSDNDNLIDIVGLIDIDNNLIPDIIEDINKTNTNLIEKFGANLTNIENTNYYHIACIIAGDDNARFYQTNSKIYRESIIEFTLNTNEKIRTYQTNKYARNYTNRVIDLVLNTNIYKQGINRYQREYTNKILLVTLDTNFNSKVNDYYQDELTNRMIEVVLNSSYTNFLDEKLYINYTNISSVITNNAELISNYYANYLELDKIKPSIFIKSPANNQIFYIDAITFNGIIYDHESGIKEGWIIVNTNKFNLIINNTNWSVIISNLVEGTNIIEVYCIDNASNTSDTNEIHILLIKHIYVSVNGNDNNDGFCPSTPLKNINLAISKAVSFNLNKILIENGVYTPGEGLNLTKHGILVTNNYISIIGGWDSNFKNRVGYSVLDGNNVLYNVVLATNVTGLNLEGVMVKNGKATNEYTNGGGIYFENVSNSTISNVVVCSNIATNNGGGIYIKSGVRNVINAIVFDNFAEFNGGGVCIINGLSNIVKGEIYSNNAGSGGGIYLFNVVNTIINCTNYYNTANYEGGAICIEEGISNLIDGEIFSNNCINQAGGIFIQNGKYNDIRGKIYNNKSFLGGGIYLIGYFNTIESLVYSNFAFISGGGICLEYGSNNLVNGLVFYNVVSNQYGGSGGGISLINERNSTISGEVYYNFAADNGGGIYISSGLGNNINGQVYNNIAINSGGGICLNNASNVSVISSYIYNNISREGGGISVRNSTNTIIYSYVYNNTNNFNNSKGGGIYIKNSRINIINGVISNNYIDGNYSLGVGLCIEDSISNEIYGDVLLNIGYGTVTYGGGIYIGNCINTRISSNNIYNNQIVYGGGGLCINNSTNFEIVYSKIYNNTNAYSYGCGVYIQNSSNVLINECFITNNYHSDPYINDSSNEIYLENICDLRLSNNTIGGAGSDYSGIKCINLQNLILKSNIFILDTLSVLFENNNNKLYVISEVNDPTLSGASVDSIDNTYIFSRPITNIYVSLDGSISNNGYSPNSPLSDIQTAIYRAVNHGINNIYIKSGIYKPGTGLNPQENGIVITNHNIRIIGGWNNDFTSITGNSILDGTNGLYHVICAKNSTNLYFSGLQIKNGYANGTLFNRNGGGIYFSNVCNSVIQSNVIIISNFALSNGGGIYLDVSKENLINCNVFCNTSDRGGGIYNNCGVLNKIYGNIYNNVVSNAGGGIYFYLGDANIINANIYLNSAYSYGDGIFIFNSSNFSIINSFITNNSSSNVSNYTIYISTSINLNKFIISNNIIGVKNSGISYGIFENSGGFITPRVLTLNKFVTNTLTYLYRYYTNVLISVGSDWTNINNPSFTGATIDSTNNIVTNM